MVLPDDHTFTRPWIRGVNLGGWLVLERFITPYLFAITSCHVEGDFCFYPGQIDAPPKSSEDYKICNLSHCQPVLKKRRNGKLDYPIDEYTLMDSFQDQNIARRFMEFHWDNFVSAHDIEKLHDAGVTHVRVPLPHWILGNDILPDEPWISGGWIYFVRLVSWCRKHGIQVWPDLHTAPGSQNGFDNSGQYLGEHPTCKNWCNSELNVKRTLRAVQGIVSAIVRDGLDDVVTGFGILNEPFKDCDKRVVENYNREALQIVRSTLGNDTSVYVGDLFDATLWNNNSWWKNQDNTLLDSHYYHVFDEHSRHLSPRQHIAFVCQKQHRDTVSCCYQDTATTVPSKGMSRIVGEWSASFDTLVDAQLDSVMAGIRANGTAPFLEKKIDPPRQAFLRNYVEAQMVTYEAVSKGVSSGWFYWTLKTEGGAFAEWDFLRGIEEGWIPNIPKPSVSSLDTYGSCYDIMFRTTDNYSIVHEYPDATSLDPNNWQGGDIDDDVVVSHGESVHGGKAGKTSGTTTKTTSGIVAQDSADDRGFEPYEINRDPNTGTSMPQQKEEHHGFPILPVVTLCFFVYAIKHVFYTDRRRRDEYTELGQDARELTV